MFPLRGRTYRAFIYSGTVYDRLGSHSPSGISETWRYVDKNTSIKR